MEQEDIKEELRNIWRSTPDYLEAFTAQAKYVEILILKARLEESSGSRRIELERELNSLEDF